MRRHWTKNKERCTEVDNVETEWKNTELYMNETKKYIYVIMY